MAPLKGMPDGGEDFLKKLASMSPGVLCTLLLDTNLHTSIPFASEQLNALFALSPSEARTGLQTLYSRIHPFDMRRILRAFNRSRKRGSKWQAEFRYNHPTRGTIWIEGASIPERRPDGSMLWYGFLHEITEKKTAANALESERLRLKTLIQTIPDPVWLKDPEGRFLSCNAAFAELYDTDEDSLIGTTDFDYSSKEDALAFRSDDQLAMNSSGPIVREEWVTFRHSGRKALWETIKSVVRDTDGSIVGVLGVARDVTDRHHLEVKLRERERYQKALLDNFPFMVWLKDTESRLLAVNQAYAKVAGQSSPDVFFGKTDNDFFPVELAEKYRADDREVLRTREKKHVEEMIVDQSELCWIETYKAPVEVDGVLVGTVGFARDITDRKRMEEAVYASERKFRTLAENAPDYIVRWDSAGKILYSNPAVHQFMESLAHPGADFKHSIFSWNTAPGRLFADRFRTVLQTGIPDAADVTFSLKDGGQRHHHVRFVPEFDREGKIQGVLAIGRDITQRKIAEAALEESESRYRELFEHSSDCIFLLDVEDSRLRFAAANPACRFLRNWTGQTVIGQEADLYADAIALKMMQTCLTTATSIRFDETIEFSSQTHYLDTTLIPITKENGEVYRIIGISRDVSDARQVKEAERARMQAEAANLAKSEFLASISHEIRTPLNALLGFTGVLISECSNPSHRAYLRSMQTSGDFLLSLVNEFLDLASIDAGRIELRTDTFDLADLISEVQGYFASRFLEQGLSLRIDIAEEGLCMIQADRSRLRQIIVNLLDNALKFTQEGYVRLYVRTQKRNSGVSLLLEVEDSGMGIPENQRDRIFTPFVQIEREGMRVKSGTGLGLSIVRRLVIAMGGSITVDTSRSGGSIFRVEFEGLSGDEPTGDLPRFYTDSTFSERPPMTSGDFEMNRQGFIKKALLLREGIDFAEIEAFCSRTEQFASSISADYWKSWLRSMRQAAGFYDIASMETLWIELQEKTKPSS